ncbi:hypothetical protein DWS19_24035 [Escherichia coli]|nr:hypothetical protein [Escherichia coli]
MADIATMRMKALHFWDKHGISAASEAFGVSCRTLYWWRQLLNKGGPEGLIPHSKAPLVRRKKHWHPDVLKEIRRLRTELPNLGKEQIFVRLKPWCAQRHLTCPSVSTIGRMIATAHDKMRMVPVRLSSRGKALLVKKRTAKPHWPKHYRLVKTGELIGMDAIELRMGEMRRYIITMIDEREFGKKLQAGRKSVSGGHKYRYEYNGQTMYWSGQGRRPNVIAEAIKAGGSLDDFLISQDTSSCSDYE